MKSLISPRVAASATENGKIAVFGERGEQLTIELVTEKIAPVSYTHLTLPTILLV